MSSGSEKRYVTGSPGMARPKLGLGRRTPIRRRSRLPKATRLSTKENQIEKPDFPNPDLTEESIKRWFHSE